MPGHTGAHGGDKPGPSRGRRGGDRRGVGGMTPGPGPGGQMVGGASPPGPGQAAAQGGTTAGFAGQGGFGGQGGGGQSLQDLFAAQQPPAQGIATIPNLPTIPTDQELMQMINETALTPFGPPPPSNTAFSQLMDLPYGYIDYSGFIDPLDEDNEPAYVGNENAIETYGLGSFPVGEGILTIDPPGFGDLIKGNPNMGVEYSFPIDFLK